MVFFFYRGRWVSQKSYEDESLQISNVPKLWRRMLPSIDTNYSTIEIFSREHYNNQDLGEPYWKKEDGVTKRKIVDMSTRVILWGLTGLESKQILITFMIIF